jgi:hypothetical protein
VLSTKILAVAVAISSLSFCLAAPGDAPPPPKKSENISRESSLPGHAFYASPLGSPTGEGSDSRPWDLQTALNQPSAVHPGDTIWLRGGTYAGTYTSHLTGTPSSPITLRQYTGERATIDGGNSDGNTIFTVSGSYTWYWGFEVMSSDPIRSTTDTGSWPPGSAIPRGDGPNIDQTTSHPGLKFINMVIHDTRDSMGLWKGAVGAEVYGCLIYYNGWQAPDRGHGHGLYAQNQAPSVMHITDNIYFSGFSHGVHVYGSSTAYLDNFDLEGNTTINSGNLSTDGGRNFLVGGGSVANNPIVSNNFMYRMFDGHEPSSDFMMGYAVGCSNATVTGNYVANWTQFVSCLPVTMTGNTFYGSISGFTQSQYPDNTYYSSRPTGIRIFIRPNTYEAGRANITIYNWDLVSTVGIDLSSILSPGDDYEIRNAQDYFAAPVVSGTYDGSPLVLPMTGLSVAPPVGWLTPQATGPEFNVFVVRTTRFARVLPVLPAPAERTPRPLRRDSAGKSSAERRSPSVTDGHVGRPSQP